MIIGTTLNFLADEIFELYSHDKLFKRNNVAAIFINFTFLGYIEKLNTYPRNFNPVFVM